MNLADVVGQRFGRLVVLRHDSGRKWLCRCDCGAERGFALYNLRSGQTTSCGCFHNQQLSERQATHGEGRRGHLTVEYATWMRMRQRCNQPSDKSYRYYGGRGIKVCPRWDRYENFIADMGRRPSAAHSIDRINSDGDYEPANCRWATATEQARNTARTVLTPETVRVVRARVASGERVADISRDMGIKDPTIRNVVDGRTWRES